MYGSKIKQFWKNKININIYIKYNSKRYKKKYIHRCSRHYPTIFTMRRSRSAKNRLRTTLTMDNLTIGSITRRPDQRPVLRFFFCFTYTCLPHVRQSLHLLFILSFQSFPQYVSHPCFLLLHAYYLHFDACISYKLLTCFLLLTYYMPCKHGLFVYKAVCRHSCFFS